MLHAKVQKGGGKQQQRSIINLFLSEGHNVIFLCVCVCVCFIGRIFFIMDFRVHDYDRYRFRFFLVSIISRGKVLDQISETLIVLCRLVCGQYRTVLCICGWGKQIELIVSICNLVNLNLMSIKKDYTTKSTEHRSRMISNIDVVERIYFGEKINLSTTIRKTNYLRIAQKT